MRIVAFETGVYSYHQNLSAFVHRNNPAKLIKQAFGSLDGCGMSYSEIKSGPSGLQGEFHSYWEKGIAGRLDLAPSSTIAHDQLPLYLRSKDLSKFSRESIKLLSSIFSSYLRELPVINAEVQNLGSEEISIGSKRFRAFHLKLTSKDMSEELWFGANPTQPLLRCNHHDGSSDTLRSLRYLYYWEHTKPGDRAKIFR